MNKGSKWYKEDMQSFILSIENKSLIELKHMYNNLYCLGGKSSGFNSFISRELNELDKGGMFNVNNCKAVNCLD